jgi:hypothetical protein
MVTTRKLKYERATGRDVEHLMNGGTKLALVLLLSALWLCASGQSLIVSCEVCSPTGSVASNSAFDSGNKCPLSHSSTSDPAGTAAHLRIVKQHAKARVVPCAQTLVPIPLISATWFLLSPGKCSSDLSTSWQFACRAALNPRAPSFIS